MKSDMTAAPLTNSDFAGYAARVAQKAAHWSADTLMMRRDLAQPVRRADALRFTAEIRALLTMIEEEANG